MATFMTAAYLLVASMAWLPELARASAVSGFLARAEVQDEVPEDASSTSECEGYPAMMATYSGHFAYCERRVADPVNVVHHGLDDREAIFFNQTGEDGELNERGRIVHLDLYQEATGSHDYFMCVFDAPASLLCTGVEPRSATMQLHYVVQVCGATCQASGLRLASLSGAAASAPWVGGAGEYARRLGRDAAADEALLEAGCLAAGAPAASDGARPCRGYPPMDGETYNLTVFEMSHLSTDGDESAPRYDSHDMPLTFYNQTDAGTGEPSKHGQFLQAVATTAVGEAYFLCVFSTGTADLRCVDAAQGSLFMELSVFVDAVCAPEHISRVISYGYAELPTDGTVVTRSSVSIALTEGADADQMTFPSVENMTFPMTDHLLSGEAGSSVIVAQFTWTFSGQSSAHGESDENGIFARLAVGPSHRICMFVDTARLRCIKAEEVGTLFVSFELVSNATALEMPSGWGLDVNVDGETVTQRALVFFAQ